MPEGTGRQAHTHRVAPLVSSRQRDKIYEFFLRDKVYNRHAEQTKQRTPTVLEMGVEERGRRGGLHLGVGGEMGGSRGRLALGGWGGGRGRAGGEGQGGGEGVKYLSRGRRAAPAAAGGMGFRAVSVARVPHPYRISRARLGLVLQSCRRVPLGWPCMQGGSRCPGPAVEPEAQSALRARWHDPVLGRWLGLTPEQPALCLRGFPRRPRVALSRVSDFPGLGRRR